MSMPRRTGLWRPVAVVGCIIVVAAGGSYAQNQELAEEEYRALCKPLPVAELTTHTEILTGRLVSMTGEILVWEEREDDGNVTTHLVLAVEDPAMTLDSGQLPVYTVYAGRIASFIYDTVTVFGEVYGVDVYESPVVSAKSLPRVDARFIDE